MDHHLNDKDRTCKGHSECLATACSVRPGEDRCAVACAVENLYSRDERRAERLEDLNQGGIRGRRKSHTQPVRLGTGPKGIIVSWRPRKHTVHAGGGHIGRACGL
eukprot:7379460-Prymnesium_polylepis.1